MKTIRTICTLAIWVASTSFAFSQTVTETIAVSGNCGMCKSRIEKAAKEAGATEATWSKDTKQLTVSFASGVTTAAKIQQKVAEVGHDNAAYQATDADYAKLPTCCKYERAATAAAAPAKSACCKKGEGEKEGKCSKEDKGEKKECCSKDAKSAKDSKSASCCSKKS